MLALPPDCHRQARVTGRVASRGEEAGSWFGVVRDARGFERAEGIDGTTGAFEIPEVPPGRYRLQIRDDEDGVLLDRPLEVAPGIDVDVGTLGLADAPR